MCAPFYWYYKVNMNNVEKKFSENSESKWNEIKQNKENVSQELWNALSEDKAIHEIIWNVKNEKIRSVLEYAFNEKVCTAEEIKKEIAIYEDEIKPKLSDTESISLFNRITRSEKVLPSKILKEFNIRDEILSQPDSGVKHLMEGTLHLLLPSVVFESKDIYEKFTKVEELDERKIISYYFDAGFSPKAVDEEYEDYVDIKNCDNEDVKELALAYVETWKMPSLAVFYLDLFKKIAEYWKETKDYILWLIEETQWKDSVETLLWKAHYYKEKHKKKEKEKKEEKEEKED